jgi:CheY-like chemotaxis protein
MIHDAENLLNAIDYGIIVIDQDNIVQSSNSFASTFLSINTGDNLANIIHVNSRSIFETVFAAPGQEFQIQFIHEAGTSYGEVKCLPDKLSGTGKGNQTLLVRDVSELQALASQLQKNRQPERKFIHDLNNALTTTIGYSELIGLVVDANKVITGNERTTLQQYLTEVYDGLKRADALIKERRHGKLRSTSRPVPFIRKHILVVDDEPSIAEFLAELMRGHQHEVTTFTSSVEALAFFRRNLEEIDLVIMDQIMPELSGISLATELLSLNIDLPIVLCTGDPQLIAAQMSGQLKIKHFIRKPIDINELSKMVDDIINR